MITGLEPPRFGGLGEADRKRGGPDVAQNREVEEELLLRDPKCFSNCSHMACPNLVGGIEGYLII